MHLPPPINYWHTYFFFLTGPGPLHEIAGSAFSRSPLGRANTLSFQPLPSRRPYISKRSSPSTLFLLPVLFFFFFCAVPHPKLLHGQHVFLASSYTLPCFLDYAIPPYSSSPFRYNLPYSAIGRDWQPVFGMFRI